MRSSNLWINNALLQFKNSRLLFVTIRPQNKDEVIAVLGPGAVGGFLTSLFWKNNFNVICIGTKKSVKIIKEKGLNIESAVFGNFIAKPNALLELDKKVDILFITTKATDLLEALKRINSSKLENTAIFPLLNGIEHMKILKEKFGENIIAGAITIEVFREKIYHIIHSSPFIRIKMAHNGNLPSEIVEKIANLLISVGIKIEVSDSEPEVLWEKLIFLNALACTTAASNKPIGWVRNNIKWRKALEGCISEAIDVSKKEGVNFSFDTVSAMNLLDNLPATMCTSMQRDVVNGKMPELEAIPGAIIRAGKKYDIPCPTIEALKNKIEEKLSQV